MKTKFGFFLLALSLHVQTTWAMPTQITYQGTLKQQGVPVGAQGTIFKNMSFRFVDAQGSTIPGTPSAGISLNNVPVTNGLFSVTLPLDPNVNWQAFSPFIEVSIEGQKLTPNQSINTNVYSMVANTIVDGAITTSKLAPNAVTTAQIAADAVTTPQLANGSVTFAKLDPASAQIVTIPSGMIAMFAGDCPGNGWTRFNALDNRFPIGSSTYGATGGAANHSHTLVTNSSGPAGGGNGVGTTQGAANNGLAAFVVGNTLTADYKSADTNSQSNLPPYLSMVYCRKL